MTRQTDLLQEQTQLLVVAAELTYNREVMSWLQDILFKISEDAEVHRYVWGNTDENRPSHVALQSLNDVLSMALAAVERLPNFSRQQGEDWYSYATYIMERCDSVRREVLLHPEWWPELTPYARSVEQRMNIDGDR